MMKVGHLLFAPLKTRFRSMQESCLKIIYASNLYDIRDGAHFITKCDNGIVAHRNQNVDEGPLDQVHIFVRKM